MVMSTPSRRGDWPGPGECPLRPGRLPSGRGTRPRSRCGATTGPCCGLKPKPEIAVTPSTGDAVPSRVLNAIAGTGLRPREGGRCGDCEVGVPDAANRCPQSRVDARCRGDGEQDACDRVSNEASGSGKGPGGSHQASKTRRTTGCGRGEVPPAGARSRTGEPQRDRVLTGHGARPDQGLVHMAACSSGVMSWFMAAITPRVVWHGWVGSWMAEPAHNAGHHPREHVRDGTSCRRGPRRGACSSSTG